MKVNYVTTTDFISIIAGSSSAGVDVSKEYMDKAHREGWLEEWDILHRDEPILRKNAARILHMYMFKVLKEPDEASEGPAWKLRDIYDCRVCAGHIAQAVDKGIMSPFFYREGFAVFEGDRNVERDEAEECVKRLFHPELRAVAIFR
ncbi:MAG: hypothetical protein K6E19_06510 [Lachnospiraceae bacterium]|nr:hypothetical protein [Lachnospiraceae bacterium]